ncbi:cytochrome C assembly family protein [Cephaloticoccus primus]|uniref:cytochrome C assembly family protein n=1 Tax=Cephaloticoccus primus TaxID=1548207 RepID=UPI001E541D2D|nr:cytochrome c biogenesis protein CcsA [Cephaloticoccus primus]
MSDREWLWIAGECYLVGFALGTWSLFRRGAGREGGRPSTALVYGIIAAGYLLQLLGLYLRGRAVGGCPLGNTFELFQFTAWSATTFYLVVGVSFRSSILGYFTACLSAVLTLSSLAIPAWDAVRRANLFGGNPWIEFHAALAIFSYGAFALLTLTALMLLLRDHSLKHKHLGGWFSFLPSLIELDQISRRLLGTGTAIMTASLLVGTVYWVSAPETVNLAKLMATLGVWAAYSVTLGLRAKERLISRRFAWVCIAVFALALLALGPVDSSRHALPPPTKAPAAPATPQAREAPLAPALKTTPAKGGTL